MKTPLIADITQRNIELISKMEEASENARTSSEAITDRIVMVMGSWTFLIVQSALLFIWMVINLAGWWFRWDPYPFILLNLVLSFQAAFTTPVILMSQNRQGRLADRRNQLDLQINLLAEQENTEQLRLLRLLCEKSGIAVNEQIGKALEETTRPDEIFRQLARKERPMN